MEETKSSIIINGEEILGRLSVSQTLNNEVEPPKLVIEGVLQTEKYFKEIGTIETERFFISDVFVYKESFGSEEPDVIYQFIAGGLDVKY